MVPIASLWAPVLLSAVIVFVVSSIIHMMLGYHRSDFAQVPDEDRFMDAMRPLDVPPGQYVVPCAGAGGMKAPEFQEKLKRGPVAFLTVLPTGPPQMGPALLGWFVYCVVVGVFAAYLTGRVLGPGAPYLTVFRFAGTVAFTGYVLALWQGTIWYKRPVSVTLKSTFDGLVYALVTGGAFGWLWPGA